MDLTEENCSAATDTNGGEFSAAFLKTLLTGSLDVAFLILPGVLYQNI